MIDRTLGKYHIVARLGSGGTACRRIQGAYQARPSRSLTSSSITAIKTNATDDAEYVTRFEREAKSAARPTPSRHRAGVRLRR